jgi:CRP-like cAMP-binding protein
MANQTLGFTSTVFRQKFRAGMSVRTYRDNEVIFSQGDKADAVFYIQSGTVKLTMAATRRKKAIIAVLLQDSFFGEGCLGGQALRMYTARSMAPPTSLDCRRRARFGRSSATRSLQRCLIHICFPALFESRKTWQINSSISAKSDWHGFCCCLGK